MAWLPPTCHEETDRRLGAGGEARGLLFTLRIFLGWELRSSFRWAYSSRVGDLGPQESKKTRTGPGGVGLGLRVKGRFIGSSLMLCPGQGFSKWGPQTSGVASPGSLLECHFLGPTQTHTSETLRGVGAVGQQLAVFNEPFRPFSCTEVQRFLLGRP